MAVVSDVKPVATWQAPVAVSGAGWPKSYVRGLFAIDASCAIASGLVAVEARFWGSVWAQQVAPYAVMSVLLPFVWAAAVVLAGGYERRFIGIGTEEFRRVLSAGVMLTAAVAIVSYATNTDLARGYVLVVLPLVTVMSLASRYAWRKRLHRQRRNGACMRRVVVVGHQEAARELVMQFRREPYHGMSVVGVCLPTGQCEPGVSEVAGCPVYGDFGSVPPAVAVTGADTVAVLTCPEIDGVELRRMAWRLEKTGTDLTVAPALMDVAGPRTTIRPVAGLPLLHVEHPELAGGRRLVKGLYDRVAAAVALVLLAPLFGVLVLLIRRGGAGPALFRQTRVGKDGAEFTLYKFRTMVVDADSLKALLRRRNEHDGVLFKMRRDPRVTPVGAWLRRYSLDELPQLVNVLRGNMSLVGPRPPLPEEVAKYGYDVRRRLVVKPGMTGLWQVSGRSDLSWEESVRLDLRYVENWSLTLDVQILWKTCSAVIRGAGAY
ncbi:sugar transferase [Nocardiopsis ansamitocini]|uniref:Exopolysaccharide biosynthesis polyprenyl glycosylphosphotransferase n=1 Tax=Nocardiopsis ansamitocini TaxID=1670832 RepID=A0A9W6UHN6_9ACTN|nr:sugar transferase [Nocardiopsis ansamitocini]GLU46907.1 exopolysaccharide biosynthesis polyprenyl glycosylphosphotransferase [Nocardiopsis ansamitocini]